MRKIFFLFFFLGSINIYAQRFNFGDDQKVSRDSDSRFGALLEPNVFRDPDSRKDIANFFYKPRYTLFDLWSDEPIFPSPDGKFEIYYATNENKIPKRFIGSSSELSNMRVYKFKNFQNCDNWCKGVQYIKSNTILEKPSNQKLEPDSTVITKSYVTSPDGTVRIWEEIQRHYPDRIEKSISISPLPPPPPPTLNHSNTSNKNSTNNPNSKIAYDNFIEEILKDVDKNYLCGWCPRTINGWVNGVDQEGIRFDKVNGFKQDYLNDLYSDYTISTFEMFGKILDAAFDFSGKSLRKLNNNNSWIQNHFLYCSPGCSYEAKKVKKSD